MKFLSYYLLLTSSIFILFQLFSILKHNIRFIPEYILNEESTWNPNIDRLKLSASLVFFILSLFLSYKIFNVKNETYNYIIYYFIITIFTALVALIPKLKDKKTSKKVFLNQNLKFKQNTQPELIKELYNDLISNNKAECNLTDIIQISKGQIINIKINWIDKIGQKSTGNAKNKEISYGYIFDIFHEKIIEGGIYQLKGNTRKELLNFIIKNFNKGGQEIKYNNLNKSYTNWIPHKK